MKLIKPNFVLHIHISTLQYIAEINIANRKHGDSNLGLQQILYMW